MTSREFKFRKKKHIAAIKPRHIFFLFLTVLLIIRYSGTGANNCDCENVTNIDIYC